FHRRTPRRRRPSPPPPPRATHPKLPADPRRERPWRHSGTRSGTSSSRRLLLPVSGIGPILADAGAPRTRLARPPPTGGTGRLHHRAHRGRDTAGIKHLINRL